METVDFQSHANPSAKEPAGKETNEPLALLGTVLPHNSAFRPIQALAKQQWVIELQMLLLKRKMKFIALTTSNWGCVTQLLQWLISARLIATPPLDNILVLSYDTMVHNLLLKKNFSSIYLNFSDIFQEPIGNIKNGIFLSRLLVIRIINQWGVSVFHCDSDALLLKNPLALFHHHFDANIIASRGRFPFELGENGPWKYTACMGAILFKSSPHMEMFWMAVHSINFTSFDDQFRINYALKMLNIIWTSNLWTESDPNFATGDNGFKLVILPSLAVCRETCTTDNKNIYYIWHSKKRLHLNLKTREIDVSELNKTNLIGDEWLRRWSSLGNMANHYSCYT